MTEPVVLTPAQIIHDLGLEIARLREENQRLRATLRRYALQAMVHDAEAQGLYDLPELPSDRALDTPGTAETTTLHPRSSTWGRGCRKGLRHYGSCDPPEAADCPIEHFHGGPEPCSR